MSDLPASEVSESGLSEPGLPMPSHLTEQQSQELLQFALHWHHVVRQQPPDRNEVGAAIGRLYKAAQIEVPLIVWCESPWQMVAIKAMLGLLGIGADSSLRQNLANELQDPRWKQMWRKLNEQITNVNLPVAEGQHCSTEDLFGTDATMDIKLSVSTKIVEAQEKVADQLSLHIKLRLREGFRGIVGDGEPAWMERTPLIVAEFGIVQLRQLLDGDLSRHFLSQLTAETQQTINDLCEARLSPPIPGLFGFSAPAKARVEQLFETPHLNSPAAMNDLDPIAFVLKYLPVVVAEEIRQPVLDWLTLKENLFHIEFFEKICMICEAPIRQELNQRNQLHNAHGAAMEFRDGCKVYAWNGVIVPAVAIEATGDITVEQIDKQENIEVRRILIQQYGLERYLKDSGAVEIDADEYGVLYKKTLPNDEPVVVVRVLNPTPEPDGTHKFYFLRVPPHITQARAAVAWTFDMKPEQYQPVSQS